MFNLKDKTMRISKLFKVLVPCVALAALFVSLQSSRSNRTLLVKNNVEAISQSYGNDPGNSITPEICYFSTKKKEGSSVYKCNIYSGRFDNEQSVEDANKDPFIQIFPCESKQGRVSKEKSDWGYCWHQ